MKISVRSLHFASFVAAVLAISSAYAQQTASVPVKYPSNELQQALTSTTAQTCQCSCDVVNSQDGSKADTSELLDQKAQLACSSCCEDDELLDAMAEHLPESQRTTEGGRVCNEPQGLLAVFLQPICWNVPEDSKCKFPFITNYNQIVVDCTTTSDTKEWCVYDMDAWNKRGEGWGYCAEASEPVPTSSSSQSSNTAVKEITPDPLDNIIANLTASQEEYLKAGSDDNIVNQVKTSGLSTEGIIVVSVICVVLVGVIAGIGVGIWKMRNRIKQRRISKFQQMDKQNSGIGPAGQEVSMTTV